MTRVPKDTKHSSRGIERRLGSSVAVIFSAVEVEPNAAVVTAFGGDPSALTKLVGGEGRSWRAGGVVLKSGSDPVRIAWLSRLATAVTPHRAFRLATPVAATDGRWLIDGWAAFVWLLGGHLSAGWDRILQVSAEFHDALASADVGRPESTEPDRSPWAVGDRVAWGEEPPPASCGAAAALLDRLAPVLARRWPGSPSQVIHGDLGGNVLFADDENLPPGVIDMSPYWRPAAFADAVIVSDAVAWKGAPLTLALRFAATRAYGDELLFRAVAYRVATAIVRWPDVPARHDAEVEAYRPILTAAGADHTLKGAPDQMSQ